MVSLLRGLPAIIAEIEQRVLACVPTAFATDTWVKADRKQYEAQNDLLIDYWRHFDLDIHDSDPSPFQGNYAYQNREIQLDLYSWYSRAGANRVAGNPDVDWQALMLQDAHDLQRALQGPIVTADGSTGRLLYDNANRSEDDEEATLVVSFRLPVFLRGTAQVPALYLGPNQAYTLNAGSTFYLVAQSDLACSAALSSSPAGCTHATALDLGSGTPQVIEVTAGPAGTYTFTLASSSGTTSCTVVVYPSSDFVLIGPDQAVPNDIWTVLLAVAAASNGILPVSGSANLTLPETVEIINNKGIIPITITARGNHTVTVGDDTCNLTSATPSATIPNFANHRTSYEAAGQYDKNRSGGIATGPNPYCLAGQDVDKVGDVKYFNVAFRFCFDQSGFNSWHNILSVDIPSSSVSTYNWAVLHNTAGIQYPYFAWRNVQNTAYYTIAPNYKLNAGVWYDIIYRYEFDTVTRLGALRYNSNIHASWTYNLTDLHEIGYYIKYLHDKIFSVNLCNFYYGKAKIYDVMICNNAQWTDQDVDNYISKATIDPSKYTLYWPLQKNTDLPYLVDYDLKNNVPLYIPGPHPNLEWVAKP